MKKQLSTRWSLLPSPAPAPLIAPFLVCVLLAGCDGGPGDLPRPDTTPPPLSGSPPPSDEPGQHGHFRGTAAIGDVLYHAEALLTVDGQLRLFVGGRLGPGSGPLTGGGLDELLDPEEARQFSGVVELSGGQAEGTGVVTGELCAQPDAGPLCGEAVPAEVSISGAYGELAGEIRIQTENGDETWLLELSQWSAYYPLRADMSPPTGSFREELAQFAEGDDVVISIDGGWTVFFQAPATGCTGNGRVKPHGDGAFYVFDVELLIENCNAAHDFLNGSFSGLATETQDNYWSYDSWLVMFLSTPEGEPPAAVTMYAVRQ